MAVTLRYFTEFSKPAFQKTHKRFRAHKVGFYSLTHKAVKFACVTKCKDFSFTAF